MRDAPVLSEVVETPQSQDRTPRCAILLAVSPAAATYRASGLVRWHLADIGVPPNVRLAPRERTLEPSPPLTEADMAGLLAASVTSERVLEQAHMPRPLVDAVAVFGFPGAHMRMLPERSRCQNADARTRRSAAYMDSRRARCVLNTRSAP